MRLTGFRLPLLAAFVSASVGLFVWATDRTYGDTLVVLPTTATISVSSPYVVPTSYVVPSSYVIPSYVETSYSLSPTVSLWPTGYVETTYRRGLFGRRWIVERPVVAAYPTAYVPTTYVSSYVPTTYVSSYVPTTYVSSYVPTTYVSSYVPTTYVAPTYYSTAYSVRRYRPTTYTYYPTLYETAYTTVPEICCDTVVVDSTVRSVPQSSVSSSAGSRGEKEVGASSHEDPTIPSYVDTPQPNNMRERRSTAQGDQGTGAQSKAGAKRADSPPNPPAAGADEDAASKAATRTEGGGGAVPKNVPAKNAPGGASESKKAVSPVAPEGDEDLKLEPAPAAGDGVVRRDSLRPVYPRLRSVDRRNILFGTVETEDGRPRGEVPVTVINRNSGAIRHSGVSNAFGGFAIPVPDGQWVVRVTMPSGNMQSVRDITVTGGKVMDNQEGREVQNLIISF
jgi:Carboxypeptidase regulatory-like domain